MIYPNRKPLLISAILVALTSVPTLVVVAAGTVSLDGHRSTASTAVGAPSDAPVIIEPGSSSGLTERPPSAGQAVQAEPMVHTLPRVVASIRGTGHRLVPLLGPAPVAPAPPRATTQQPVVPEGDVPSSTPPSPTSQPSQPAEPSQSAEPSPSPSRGQWSPQGGTPTEPRIDDQAWPGWDAHLPGG
jgi:hypothetical protein